MASMRLHVWGSNLHLPTLDPTSLYAASLLQASFHQTAAAQSKYKLSLSSASTSTGTCVPLLEVTSEDGSVLHLTELEKIQELCRDEAGLDSELVKPLSAAASAKATALHALLDDELLDLVLHSLFSLPENYRAVTAPSYASIGSSSTHSDATGFNLRLPGLNPTSSIPSRLRNVVQARLASPGVGLWGLGGKEDAAQRKEAIELEEKANIMPKSKRGLDQSMKEKVRDEFERGKLGARARTTLEVFSSLLGDEAYFFGSSRPSSLDLHLFAYLAPLLLCHPSLPASTLPVLLRSEFPNLVRHTENIREELWPIEERTVWPEWLPPSKPLPSSGGATTGSSWWTLSNLFSLSSSSSSSPSPSSSPTQDATPPTVETPTNASAAEKKASPEARPSQTCDRTSSTPAGSAKPHSRPPLSREERRLRFGRLIWICTAFLGIVGWTFASGISETYSCRASDLVPVKHLSANPFIDSQVCPRIKHIVTGSFNTDALHVLAYDTQEKKLSLAKTIPGQGPHQFLALGLTRNGEKVVYATTWAARKSLSAWKVVQQDGSDNVDELRWINTADITATSSYVHVQPPPYDSLTAPSYGLEPGASRHLYSAGGPTGEVHELDDETGAILSKKQEFIYLKGGAAELVDADKSRRALRYGSHNLDVGPNDLAYVADLGRNAILVYLRDPWTGLLTLLSECPSPRPGDGPRHVVPSPDGLWVFSVTEHTSFVDAFRVKLGGVLEYVESVDLIPPNLDRHDFRGDTVRLSPDARTIFATTRGMNKGVRGFVKAWEVDLAAASPSPFVAKDRPVVEYRTINSGGKANAIEFAPRYGRPLSGGGEFVKERGPRQDLIVLTDDEQGYVQVFSWDGIAFEETGRVRLTGKGPEGEDEGASHAIWIS
ncbi:3-carboxy-cis,cis-mucoante lactonizing enzyme [Violaceomyces palustris]|uniref:3-carboxy-cis,cis-mucoante lactonizing enzyme n=1 Tax=Violaceomyces palustris TaxID=1673888 RepID=A0ACD0P882_9BASI|nr:3-carboxy-cis,cis-mucoante lactonizing enzyme [Violaceomyces palustris]